MNEFIEKNKKLLKFYHTALRLSGWLLLAFGLCNYGITIILARSLSPKVFGLVALNLPLRSSYLIFFSLLGLGIAQLIRYIYDSNYKPGRILRHGDKFIYIYIILFFAFMVVRNIFAIKYIADSNIQNSSIIYFSTLIASVALFVAKALVLIGLAQFLKRVMPVIEESKTLV